MIRITVRVLVMVLPFVGCPAITAAQVPDGGMQQADTSQPDSRVAQTVGFFAGALGGLAIHEAGHVALDVAFDANPHVKRVDFHGIPFFAIAHRGDLSPRREQAVSSIGFWIQHASSEWILTRDPRVRSHRAPARKGILAFNVATSAAYAGAAFARTGPAERDTRGMAESARIDERWVGAMLLVPAAMDAWRYCDPDAKWAAWTSRAAKVGMLLLMFR
jgi:hypothetical protein